MSGSSGSASLGSAAEEPGICTSLGLDRIGYHHILMFTIGVATVVSALLLAGCSSDHPALSNIYLMALSYRSPSITDTIGTNKNLSSVFATLVGGAQLTVRAGYFGLCVSLDDNEWTCSSNTAFLTNAFNASVDPLDLIGISSMFKSSIVFSGLIFISISLGLLCFCALGTFPGYHEDIDEQGFRKEVKAFPVVIVSHCATAVIAAAGLFSITASLWQHIATVAAATSTQNMAYGWVKGEVGPAAMVLGWTATVAYMLVTCALIVMVMSMRLLGELVGDD